MNSVRENDGKVILRGLPATNGLLGRKMSATPQLFSNTRNLASFQCVDMVSKTLVTAQDLC